MTQAPSKRELKKNILLFLKLLDQIPEFTYLGDPILRKKTSPVNLKDGLSISGKLGKILIRYRKITGFGRGLAAPQIGIDKSVFVTFLDGKIKSYLNPKIISRSVRGNYCRELCLSCGFVWPDVKRPETVNLEWKDETGKLVRQEFSGLEARLVQHEYDHLYGIPNIDRAERGTLQFCTSDPLAEKLRSHL